MVQTSQQNDRFQVCLLRRLNLSVRQMFEATSLMDAKIVQISWHGWVVFVDQLNCFLQFSIAASISATSLSLSQSELLDP